MHFLDLQRLYVFWTAGFTTAICQLTELCLRTTYFEFQEFYEEVDGAAMGSPPSQVIANIFMEGFEQEALNTAADQPSLWVRFVDDTFVIWPHGLDKLENLQSPEQPPQVHPVHDRERKQPTTFSRCAGNEGRES